MVRGVVVICFAVLLELTTTSCLDVLNRPGTRGMFEVGALYSVDDGEGWFRVAKALAVDEKGVHIRLYKNRFKSRPATVDKAVLSLGRIDDPEGFGMGHIPLMRAAFIAWRPELLERGTVSSEELDGFLEWQKGGGGYFGNE